MLQKITKFDTVTKARRQNVPMLAYRVNLVKSKSTHQVTSSSPEPVSFFYRPIKTAKDYVASNFPRSKNQAKICHPSNGKGGGEELLLVIEWPPPSRKILKFYVSSQCNNCWLPTSANNGSSKEIFLLFISVQSLFFERREGVVGQ